MRVHFEFVIAVCTIPVLFQGPGRVNAMTAQQVFNDSHVYVNGEPMRPDIVVWVKSDGSLPTKAFPVEPLIPSNTFVCRAENTGTLPGIWSCVWSNVSSKSGKNGAAPGPFILDEGSKTKGLAHIAWDEGVNMTKNCQILTTTNPELFNWTAASPRNIPANAVEGGLNENNIMQYIAKFDFASGPIYGRYVQDQDHCFGPNGLKEEKGDLFFILTLDLKAYKALVDAKVKEESH